MLRKTIWVKKEIEVEIGRYYEAMPTDLGVGKYMVVNINHHSKVVQVKDVRNGNKCWTKLENIGSEIPQDEIILELIE